MAKLLIIDLAQVANNPIDRIENIKDVIDVFGKFITVQYDMDKFECFWAMNDEEFELMKELLGNNIYDFLEKFAGLQIK